MQVDLHVICILVAKYIFMFFLHTVTKVRKRYIKCMRLIHCIFDGEQW